MSSLYSLLRQHLLYSPHKLAFVRQSLFVHIQRLLLFLYQTTFKLYAFELQMFLQAATLLLFAPHGCYLRLLKGLEPSPASLLVDQHFSVLDAFADDLVILISPDSELSRLPITRHFCEFYLIYL